MNWERLLSKPMPLGCGTAQKLAQQGGAKAPRLQRLAFATDGIDGLRLADFGWTDFAHGGVAGALAGTPHVPTGDGAVGAPALAEG